MFFKSNLYLTKYRAPSIMRAEQRRYMALFELHSPVRLASSHEDQFRPLPETLLPSAHYVTKTT